MTVLRYPNAYRGVKKIFIGLLICFGLVFLPDRILTICSAFGVLDSYDSIFMRIHSSVGSFARCLYYVLLLLGVLQARRDEPAFRSARLPLCIAFGIFFATICMELIDSFIFRHLISDNAVLWIYRIPWILYALCCIWAGLSIVNGCITLANKLKARGLARFGRVLSWLLPIACVRSLISSFSWIILQLMNSSLHQPYKLFFLWVTFLSNWASVLDYLIYILLLICLGCTLRLLRNQAPEIEPETEIAP